MQKVDDKLNYFADAALAERYASARPYFHPLVVDRIRALLPDDGQLDTALDFGCGTGQSSVALTAIARSVTGIDSAEEMLAQAIPHERVRYAVASAEALPFDPQSFDLCTVGSALHWFDLEVFLAGVGRVLKPGRWLAVYNDSFGGEMVGNPDFAAWNADYYVRQFPTPPRKTVQLTSELARSHGLSVVGDDAFEHLVQYTPQNFVTYLTTQTNVAAALKRRPLDDITAELMSELVPLFDGAVAHFAFRCSLSVFRLN